jgi:hypothetical protein
MDELSNIFINPNGKLCSTVILFDKQLFTLIDVEPRFDGYDVAGNIINLNDWVWIVRQKEIQPLW